jgi:hypothetical protein
MRLRLPAKDLFGWTTGQKAVRGIRVDDIMSMKRSQVHSLTRFARVQGHRITYPADNRSGGRVPLLRFPESLRSYQFASGDLVLEQGLGSGYPLGAKFFAHSFPCAAGNSDYIFCG